MAKKKLNQLDPAAITLTRLLGHGHPSTGKMNRATIADLLALFTGQTPVKTYADEAAMLANTDLVIGYIAFEADTETFYLYNGPTPDDINNYTEFGGGGAGTVTSLTGTANRIAVDLTNPAVPVVNIDAAYDTAIAALIAAAQVGLWDDRGTFSAAGGAYPSSGGSGTAGAILKGDIWTISTGGTLPTGQVVEVGDTVRALIDTPGNTQANWAILQNNIGYVPVNKAGDTMGGNLAMGTNKVTGLGAASANGEAVRYEQLILKQDLVNAAVVLTDASSMDLTAIKHTLTTSSATRTFTISYTGDDITLIVTLNTTATVFTFPATALCVSDGIASGDNTLTIAAASGDKIVIAIKKVGSNYYVVAKNFGQ